MTSNSPILLLVEDEPQIRRFVRAALENDDWTVVEASSLRQGMTDAATHRSDLIILDLGLPDGDGMDLIRDVRSWSSAPIIVLSARSDERDKVAALDAGADDYLIKPFSLAELLARVRVARRRMNAPNKPLEESFALGDLRVDFTARTVEKAGRRIHLTPIEYRLLSLLIKNAGRVLTHQQILTGVWGPAHSEHEHYVRIHMGHLRTKLEDDPAQPVYLLTETGVGYRLVASLGD